MNGRPKPIALPLILAGALGLSACAGTYTGPVEVTTFVAEDPAPLAKGEITITFPDEIENERVKNAFADAVARELGALGYTLVMAEGENVQVAAVRTSRDPIEGAGRGRRSPVSVGAGASTGTYGSGVGLGIGINLGGGERGPAIVTELSVRISDPSGESLWEGRAQLPTSIKSPYSDVEKSADTLAAALFRDFPGGNGETVQVTVRELERTP
ncbi:hypothetical protein [Erythrobacter sp. THAF29]|uniref:hypothetical protein n=1 Tax=Erythrobacter sp. THAF29 TaxID=2587851 RepID=UPI0012689C1F|nr:hypothetical protein [Erythrobacter sp. THAF29]QFT75939.1 hypothetical protein FIU90_00150 [Erythrobacter sp. THAF29]